MNYEKMYDCLLGQKELFGYRNILKNHIEKKKIALHKVNIMKKAGMIIELNLTGPE